MPVLVINMGAEMMYILEQRLVAQAITPEKSRRVTREVCGAMLGGAFLDEVFRPQPVYSAASARQLFHRLAHSSIMRLNATSFEKLYDLMTMGFKYQLFRSSEPADVVQVTLNHLDNVRGIVSHSPDAVRLVNDAAERVIARYAGMTPHQALKLRRTLFAFMQDRRIKVSLFLQSKQQKANGMIVVSHRGRLPAGGERPGAVRYYGAASAAHPERQSHVALGSAEGVEPPAEPGFDLRSAEQRPCGLGQNMYAERERQRKAGAPLPDVEPPSPRGEAGEAHLKASSAVAGAELSVLAGLISLGGAAAEEDGDGFTLANLFPDTALDSIGDGAVLEAEVVRIGDAPRGKPSAGLGEPEEWEGGEELQEEEEEDDLLALMDGAAL